MRKSDLLAELTDVKSDGVTQDLCRRNGSKCPVLDVYGDDDDDHYFETSYNDMG